VAVQYNLPIKIFILNNQYMGMVRQWQQLAARQPPVATPTRKPCRTSSSWRKPMAAVGMYCDDPKELDGKIEEMIAVKKPVIFDCRVANLANCFPMIPSGKAA
jgi:acetolactate synthase-1/2/3 large subunit